MVSRIRHPMYFSFTSIPEELRSLVSPTIPFYDSLHIEQHKLLPLQQQWQWRPSLASLKLRSLKKQIR
jgi:hypothetical protein